MHIIYRKTLNLDFCIIYFANDKEMKSVTIIRLHSFGWVVNVGRAMVIHLQILQRLPLGVVALMERDCL